MTIEEIKAKLDAAGVEYSEWTKSGVRLYVRKTRNGKRDDYGYLVAANDVRDITAGIVKRGGEISAILRAP